MEWCALQDQIFSYSAEKIGERLPKRLSLATISDETIRDLRELQEKKLIKWDFSFKSQSFATPVSNVEHQVTLVAYYGDAETGYCCIGAVLGCVSEDKTALEISLIEKRCDADSDLDGEFLPITIDTFAAYALFLNSKYDFAISTIALIGPIDGVKRYYIERNFHLVADYKGTSMEAMVLYNN